LTIVDNATRLVGNPLKIAAAITDQMPTSRSLCKTFCKKPYVTAFAHSCLKLQQQVQQQFNAPVSKGYYMGYA